MLKGYTKEKHKTIEYIHDKIISYNIQLKLFFSCVLCKTIFNIFFLYILKINNGPDEIGAIAGAAFGAGKDWTELLKLGNQYFGMGYTILMSPIFLLTTNKFLIYQLMLLYNSICLGLGAVICYNIVKILFDKKHSDKICIYIALSSSLFYFALTSSNVILNDNMLLLLHWAVLYLLILLCKKQYDNKDNKVLSIFLALVLCYGITVHTRIIYLWGGVLVFFLMYFIMNRKLLLNCPLFLSTFGLGYACTAAINKYVQNNWWGVGKDDIVLNSTESIGNILSRIENITSWEGIKSYAATILGELYGVFTLTGGIVAISLCVFIYMLIMYWKEKSVYTENQLRNRQMLLLTGGFGISILIATIGLTSIGALPYSMEALSRGEETKWFLYARYWPLGAGSCILFALIAMAGMRINKKFVLTISGVFLFIIIFLITWRLADNFEGVRNSTSAIYEPYSAIMIMEWGEQFSRYSFIKAGLFTGLIFSGMCWCYLKGKNVCGIKLLLMYSIFIWLFCSITIDRPSTKKQYERFTEIESVLKNIEAKENGFEIYLDLSLQETRNAFFSLNDYVLKLFPEETPQAAEQIVISNAIDMRYIGNGYYRVQKVSNDGDLIDTNFYIKGHHVRDVFIQRGYELEYCNTVIYIQDRLRYLDASQNSVQKRGIIPIGGIQYGPYFDMPAGRYKITIFGEQLDDCDFDVMARQKKSGVVLDNNEDLIVYPQPQEVIHNSGMISYIINLTEAVERCEFRIFNNGDTEASIWEVGIENN